MYIRAFFFAPQPLRYPRFIRSNFVGDLHLLSPKGFQASGVKAGIKASGNRDVGLLLANAPATAAAVFTASQVVAAPVVVGRKHVAAGKLRGHRRQFGKRQRLHRSSGRKRCKCHVRDDRPRDWL